MLRALTFGVLLLACDQVLAWSDEAHIAICEIAMVEIAPSTRELIEQLQRSEDNEKFRDFPTACTWADYPPRQRRGEHFINVPRNQGRISSVDCPIGDDCLFTAIDLELQVLANRDSSSRSQWEALKFLGHWVGDIHQPLHVSFRDDNGGNKIEMFDEAGCFKTLHGAWDHCIPERIMLNYGTGDPKEFGLTLRAEITEEEKRIWKSKLSKATWANESLSIALDPAVGYCVQIGQHCQYDEDRIVLESDGEQKYLPLSVAYKEANSELVATRLKQAGIRLAKLLDDVAEDPGL